MPNGDTLTGRELVLPLLLSLLLLLLSLSLVSFLREVSLVLSFLPLLPPAPLPAAVLLLFTPPNTPKPGLLADEPAPAPAPAPAADEDAIAAPSALAAAAEDAEAEA